MSPTKDAPTDMTLMQASREVGLSDQTLRKFVKKGKLVAILRPNGRYAISRDELLRFHGWYRGSKEGN